MRTKKKIIVGSDADENEKEGGEEGVDMEVDGEDKKKKEDDEQQEKKEEEEEKKRKEEERKRREDEEKEQEAEAMSSPRTSRRATVASSPPDQVIQLKIMTTFVEPSNPEIPFLGPLRVSSSGSRPSAQCANRFNS